MRHAREDAATLVEPEWYAWLSILSRCRDGDRLAHEIGRAHPGYSEAETADKLRRALEESGPRTCAAIRTLSPACRGCTLAVTSPVLLGKPDPVTATVEEVREDRAVRTASAVERTRAAFEAQTRIVADLTVDEARARAVATHARQYGTPETAAAEAGAHAALKIRLRDEKERLKEAERLFDAAEAESRRATRLAQADPRILSDPLFALDAKTGLPRSSLGNVSLVLERDPTYSEMFAYNLFDEKIYYGGKLAADHHDSEINIDIERRYGFSMKTSIVQEAIMKIAHERAFHPVRDYLTALEWDGEDRLDSLFTVGFGAAGDASYLQEAGRKFGIGAVARILTPGCQLDTMIVLTGKQGAGKSTGLRVLAGSEWFADSALHLGDKDSYMQLAGRWFYEIAELDSFRKAENTRIKAFITSRDDTFRPPYGRHVVKRARQTVLVGSTNEREFLNDPTGSRRFVPVTVGAVDLGWLTANRDQLWAEAVIRFQRGEIWYYAGASAERLSRESAPYQQDDPWEPLVHEWLVRRKLATCTVLDALTGAVGVNVAQISKGEKSRMIAVLRALGCEEYRPATDDGVYRQRAFRVPAEVLDNVTALPVGRAPAFGGVA
jgi:putative DNA primase/helicase